MFYDDANKDMKEARGWITDNFTWLYVGSQASSTDEIRLLTSGGGGGGGTLFEKICSVHSQQTKFILDFDYVSLIFRNALPSFSIGRFFFLESPYVEQIQKLFIS